MSTIVIDVGCATHGGDASIPHLLVDYAPDELWGFDPSATDAIWWEGETKIITRRAAAWTHDGMIGWAGSGLGGQVDEGAPTQVRCDDLAAFILSFKPGPDLILKLDCEGAEYVLLPHLVATGAAARLRELCVEFHCATCNHGIWDDAYHPGGCTADKEAWRMRRDSLITAFEGLGVRVTEWSH